MPTAPPASVGLRVQLRHVRKTFDGGVQALGGVSLNIHPGDFVALLGPSGCGKSTLLRLIAGLDRADDADGITVGEGASLTPGELAYVFQDAHLLPWRSVLRNVTLPLEIRGMQREEQRERAMAELRRVGLADVSDRYPAQLSGGMRMRVSLARAMVTQPRLLMLDEPFAALDEITRQSLDEQLRALWMQSGMTVLFVTHSIMEATYLARRCVVLSRRPARVVLDHEIALPTERPAALRGEPAFAHEMSRLLAALTEGSR